MCSLCGLAGSETGGVNSSGLDRTRTIALTIEFDLLRAADAYAKREGLKRSQALRERLEAS